MALEDSSLNSNLSNKMDTKIDPEIDEKSAEDMDNTAYPTVRNPSKKSIWAKAFYGGYGDATARKRIAPVLPHLRVALQDTESASISDDGGSQLLEKQLEMEKGHTIKYRSCGWKKTAALLFSEYICLAIMSFPYSYATLGLVPGIILTVVVAALVLYTSLVVWEFCLRHPEVRDVCDIGQMLFWGSEWAWWLTAIMFVLNNTFIQGLHVLTSAKYLNTMTAHDTTPGHENNGLCTVAFAAIATVVCFFGSLPRTFSVLSQIGTWSAFFTFVSVILASIFAGIQDHPEGYTPALGNPLVTAVPVAGVTFVAGLNAFLNISYTFIGQITIPSFIAEMENPKDFPKALWAVTIAEVILFSCVGGVIYGYTGNQYYTAPAFGSLHPVFKKVSFTFMIPTLVFLGVLYASVSARFVMFRIFKDGSRHKSSNTVKGWAVWAGILAVTWVFAFIIAEVIPFFSDLLSLMSSLFDSFFGFIFWGLAYIRMRRVDKGANWIHEGGASGYAMLALNVVIIFIGLFFLGAGTYTSVRAIIDSYAAGTVGGVFTCVGNGL